MFLKLTNILLLVAKDPETNEDLALGQYMYTYSVTHVSQLILKEGDSDNVKLVKGNARFKFSGFDDMLDLITMDVLS